MRNITTKEWLAIVAKNDPEKSDAWDPEFATDVTKLIKLLMIELEKVSLIVDDPKHVLTTMCSMKDAEKSMIKLQANFDSFCHKYNYLIKTTSLESVPSTIADIDNLEEHGEDFDHGSP